MIIYCVSITIDPGIESEWVDWIKRIHVPDVVRTGCFSECRIYKVIDPDAADPSYAISIIARRSRSITVTGTILPRPSRRSTPISSPDAFVVFVSSWRRSPKQRTHRKDEPPKRARLALLRRPISGKVVQP